MQWHLGLGDAGRRVVVAADTDERRGGQAPCRQPAPPPSTRQGAALTGPRATPARPPRQITEKTDFLRPVPTTPCDSDAIAAKAASAGDSVVVVPTSTAAEAAAGWDAGR